MTNLDEVSRKWLELYDAVDHLNPAGLFAAYAHPQHRTHAKRVLYVGKATGRDFGREAFLATKGMPANIRLGQVDDTSAGVFRRSLASSGATFWGFASEVSRLLDPNCEDMSNLIWSNLAKIGSQVDNPTGHLLTAQLPLCEATLMAEIRAFQPTLVVFVTNKFAETALRAAVDGEDHAAWEKSRKLDEKGQPEDIWFMRPRADRPAVLWMPHPQFSSLSLRNHALEHMKDLLA